MQASTDGVNFSNIAGASYSVSANTATGWVNFAFTEPVTAKYIRIVTVRGGRTWDNSGWLVKITELEVYGTGGNVTDFINGIRPDESKLLVLDGALSNANPFVPETGIEKLLDNDTSTSWIPSTDIHLETSNAWARIALSTKSQVSDICLYATASVFPREFKLQYSMDGTTFTDIPDGTYTMYADAAEGWLNFNFATPVEAKYVRIFLIRNGPTNDGNWLSKIAEIDVYGTAVEDKNTVNGTQPDESKKLNITGASSTADAFVPESGVEMIWDGNTSTAWIPSTDIHSETSNASARITLETLSTVTDMRIYASATVFPREFKIQYSTDGSNFTDVAGGLYWADKDAAVGWFNFNFSTPVTAKYMRILIVRNGPTNDGNWLTKIAEVETFGTAGDDTGTNNGNRPDENKLLILNGAISNADPFLGSDANSVNNLWDGDTSTSWIPSTDIHLEASNAWARIALSAKSQVSDISLFATATVFPREFKLQYSIDGTNFTDIPGGAYQMNADADEGWFNFNFATSVEAKYIRIFLVKNGPTNDGNWLSKIAEIEVYGTAGEDKNTANGTQPDETKKLNITGAMSTVDPFLPESGIAMLWDDDTSTSWIPSTDIHSETSNAVARVTLETMSTVTDMRIYATATVFPREFQIQYSTDGSNFTDVAGGLYWADGDAPEGWFNFNFATPVTAKYMRIVIIRNGPTNDGNWLTKIAEVEVFGTAGEDNTSENGNKPDESKILTIVNASSNKDAFVDPANGVSSLYDDDTSTSWIPNADIHSETTDSYAVLQLEQYSQISAIQLYATASVFPREFQLQASNDGVSFTDITGGHYKADGDPDEGWFNFNFTTPIEGKYVRILVQRNGPTSDGNWLTKIAEVKIYGVKTELKPKEGDEIHTTGITASSTLENSDFTTDKLNDGDVNTFWCAQWGNANKAELDEPEWATIGFESICSVGKVVLYPSVHVNGNVNHFPANFKLQYSTDGKTFKDVAGQSYTNYTAKLGANEFVFSSPVNAKYIRVVITKKGMDGDTASAVFLVKIAEMKAYYGSGAANSSPDTGDVGSALALAVLTLSAGALIISKKKK